MTVMPRRSQLKEEAESDEEEDKQLILDATIYIYTHSILEKGGDPDLMSELFDVFKMVAL